MSESVAVSEPGTLSPEGQGGIITYHKLLAQAIKFGIIIPGWTILDYMKASIEANGLEVLHIWGYQGSKKSNMTLCMGYWILQDWDKVLKYLAFRPGRAERGIQKILDGIGHGNRIPWLGWDDMGVHYPSTTYKTNMQQYEAVDAAFGAMRTKVSVVTSNNHIIDRAPKNIKDNISIELFLGRNQMLQSQRLCRLPSYDQVNSYFFKVPVEKEHIFTELVPPDVWAEYWDLRLTLADEALAKLGEAYDDDVGPLGEYVPIYEVVEQGIATPAQIISYSARGVFDIIKIEHKRYIHHDDVEHILKHLGKKKPQKESK